MARKNNLKKAYRRPGYYIQRWGEYLESPAYRSLKPLPRCLLEEFQIIYRPGLNGRLVLSHETAAKRLGVTTKTVSPAFAELIEKGFIELCLDSDYSNGKAREYRLTFEPFADGREPSDEWKLWGQKPE